MTIWQFGPLTLSVTGVGPVYEALAAELGSLPVSKEERADVEFRFVSELDSEPETIQVGRWRLADNFVARSGHGYEFSMRRDGPRFAVSIAADSTDGSALYRTYRKVWDWNFLTPAETVAKNIMYNLFDLVTGAAFLEKDATYLHASTCSRGDEALALIAWGGVGKTTSVLKLVTEEGWKFMSDDLGLVDAGGTLFRTPKRLQVYAYNVAGQPELFRRVMEGRGPADRVNWHWRLARFGDKKVRRRIGAEELFGGENVAESATLTEAIFLERADVPKISWSDLTAEELARRSATILVDELNVLFELAVAAESHDVDTGLGTLDELRERSEAVLKQALRDKPTRCLHLPLDAGPDELAAALSARPA